MCLLMPSSAWVTPLGKSCLHNQELYTSEEETEGVLEKRRVVAGRRDKGLTERDNQIMEEVPSEELITRIVMEMPREKSPGLDGVMVEMLRTGWEFMREDCFLMVQGFWANNKLIGKDGRGLIKLIPKNERKRMLKNWMPITLLTTTYKIIAKIFAIRLKEMLPRGVRQGCPLAPLLFAMTTQPLMLALREEERIGTIQGLNIGGGRTLLHQLFADDTGICITAVESQFNRLKEVIGEFEGASGACLNLQKSIVMQLRPRGTPTWLEQSGCEVAEPGKSFLYLGVRTSSPIDERAIAAKIVQKMMQKLKHWSNKILS
ncbi:hypothetical protein R1sor_020010 [Riccia sorocarpa]|uniref:Reverse transcriptase domain-containing protein n=1 Tax=Riccia sorocarpa TaxID=122646 RepID=A0ABD3IE85_9MARC